MYETYNESQFCILTSYVLLGVSNYKLCKRIPSHVHILKHHSSYEFRFLWSCQFSRSRGIVSFI